MMFNQASNKRAVYNAVKVFFVMLLICWLLMLAVKQVSVVKSIYDEVQSYDKQVGVHLQVLPNGIDLMGVALQMPFLFLSQGSTNYPIKIAFDIHILSLLLIPSLSVLLACRSSFIDKQSTKAHMKEYLETALGVTILSQVTLAMNAKQIYFEALQHYGIAMKGAFSVFEGIVLSFTLIFLIQIIWSIVIKREVARPNGNALMLGEVFFGLGTYLKQMVLYSSVTALIFLIWLSGTFGVKWQLGTRMIVGLIALPNIAAANWGMLLGGEWQGFVSGVGAIQLSVLGQAGLLGLPFLIITVGITARSLHVLCHEKFLLKASILGILITVCNILIALAASLKLSVNSSLTILKLVPLLNESSHQYLYMPLWQVIVASILNVGVAVTAIIIKRKLSRRE